MYLITEIDMRNGTFIPVTRIIPSPVCSLEWSAEFVHRWRIVYPSCGMPGRAAIGDIALPMKIRGEPGIVRRTHANKESEAQIRALIEADQIQRGPNVEKITEGKQRPGWNDDGSLPCWLSAKVF